MEGRRFCEQGCLSWGWVDREGEGEGESLEGEAGGAEAAEAVEGTPGEQVPYFHGLV